jgi:hypothetical protein
MGTSSPVRRLAGAFAPETGANGDLIPEMDEI